MNKRIIVLVIIVSCIFNLNISAQQNMLTAKEKADGWQLLFDGKNLNGWHSYMEEKAGQSMAGSKRDDIS